eukprot:502721-Pleurochrysis_carterae.AAC.1
MLEVGNLETRRVIGDKTAATMATLHPVQLRSCLIACWSISHATCDETDSWARTLRRGWTFCVVSLYMPSSTPSGDENSAQSILLHLAKPRGCGITAFEEMKLRHEPETRIMLMPGPP